MAMPMSTACEGKKKRGATPCCAALAFQPCLSRLSLVRDGQSFSAFAAAGGQHFSTVGGRHSLAETVLVGSFSQRGLECSLHIVNIFFVLFYALYGGLSAVKLSLQKYINFLNCEQKMFAKKTFCITICCKTAFSVWKINSCFAV